MSNKTLIYSPDGAGGNGYNSGTFDPNLLLGMMFGGGGSIASLPCRAMTAIEYCGCSIGAVRAVQSCAVLQSKCASINSIRDSHTRTPIEGAPLWLSVVRVRGRSSSIVSFTNYGILLTTTERLTEYYSTARVLRIFRGIWRIILLI